MHTTNLRKVGGSVMLVVPPVFLDQLHLQAGATVGLAVDAGRLVMEPKGKLRYSLTELMAEMPDGLPRVDGWDDMPKVGLEGF